MVVPAWSLFIVIPCAIILGLILVFITNKLDEPTDEEKSRWEKNREETKKAQESCKHKYKPTRELCDEYGVNYGMELRCTKCFYRKTIN